MHIVKAVFSLYLPFYGVMAVPLTLYFPQYLIWFPLPHTPIPTIRPVRPLLLLRCGHTLLIADLFSRRAGTRPPRYARRSRVPFPCLLSPLPGILPFSSQLHLKLSHPSHLTLVSLKYYWTTFSIRVPPLNHHSLHHLGGDGVCEDYKGPVEFWSQLRLMDGQEKPLHQSGF